MPIDPADVRPSLLNWFIVGLLAFTWIVTMKFLFARVRVPGLSELIASV